MSTGSLSLHRPRSRSSFAPKEKVNLIEQVIEVTGVPFKGDFVNPRPKAIRIYLNTLDPAASARLVEHLILMAKICEAGRYDSSRIIARAWKSYKQPSLAVSAIS